MTTVAIPVYAEVTQLDFTAPHQLLFMVPNIKVIFASVGSSPVTSTGLTFGEVVGVETIKRYDVLCVPDGIGCVDTKNDECFMAAVRRPAKTAQYQTSVCAGSLILGAEPDRRAISRADG